MVKKSMIVTLFSYLIYFIPTFFIWYIVNHKLEISYFRIYTIQFLFYSFPVILVTFVGLLTFNSLFEININKRSVLKNNKLYFLLTALISILPTLGLTIYDYSQSSRFGSSSGTFLDILAEYALIFIFILLVFLINRRICFNNFK